ncbi:unnamed protein product [Mytilus coruscus]|uniref:Reverse transcriptase/retrotransposon-derived protein RNase H-like domain-containing protein n=1 Tax=Mytilus coruscus TaxID=42192 RepID=A0A6J8DMM2_MYTCO|nr:unnamed protein product [Mytilus coruscus]
MANYYRKFVKDYTCIASPLTSLLKTNIKFNWTLECQRAFDTLKNAHISAPILVFPEFDKPIILSTDASEYPMGYVLSQIQNGVEHPIAYGGRSLRGSELRLKPYYDPNTRPTNPPPEHENDEDELDPDEIGQQDNNDRQQQNRGQQNGDNNDRQQQNRGQQNGDNNDRQQQNRGQRNDDNNNRLQPNRDQRIEDNNNQNQPRNQPVGNTKPSCQDCKRGNCTPFKEENIDRLMASNRGNGTLYYKIKFKAGQTECHFPCKIPTNIVRQIHADRTMSGKKRK